MTDTQVMAALEPCPFCGSDELSHGYTQAGIVMGNVECHSCNARIWADSEAVAIAAWNRRASSSPAEPVGWISDAAIQCLKDGYADTSAIFPLEQGDFHIPLYAAPVPPPAGDAALRRALRDARDALLTVGNDYPGSSCQQWCTDKARETWNAINPWAHCPSTHCERAQECRSINECSAERSTLSTPPSLPAQQGEEWQDIATAPRDGTEFVAAIKVRHIRGRMWWERHVIAYDDDATNLIGSDYDHGWAFDDYELWMSLADLPPLPATPPAQDQTNEVTHG